MWRKMISTNSVMKYVSNSRDSLAKKAWPAEEFAEESPLFPGK